MADEIGNLATYLYLPGNALGTAMLTIVAQCYGAGRKKEAKHYAKVLILLNYVLVAIICAGMILGNRILVSMYNLTGQSADYASSLIVAHAICMVIWPLAFLTPYYFRAIGRASFTMVVSISIMFLFRVGFAYLFVKLLGKDVVWIWYAMFIDWVARVIVYMTAFAKEGKESMM